ncbi:unnamed protein product [Aureobasidium vineae]|uniref:GH16 domain-containing protein n=1 Tax=Aureobasidium vineae TaxID=2773715 RepID=A0A9N8JT05_9PEZI|nr:unnamed protein product [Aureobasidium vineae]
MGVLPFLSLVLPAVSQSIPGASFFKGGGIAGSGAYELVDDYQPSVFFSKFNFYNVYLADALRYVNESVATTNGYATTLNDSVTISVDTTNKWPNGGSGRPAVRIISDNTYTHGLFVLDLSHMPYGCGTWPAFWLLGPDWPGNGEIDIIEGVHTSDSNTVSMHSSPNCTVAGSGQTGLFTNANCDSNANGNSGCGSMSNNTATSNNYGQGLSNNGGGVYITEWTSAYVRVWFFPRGGIPASVTDGSPDVSEFGLPMANFQGSCDIDSHFANHSIIINTDFCGAWAGFAYSNFANCPLTAGMNGYDSCVDFVGNNPQNFTQAYWEINSIKVYQLPVNVDPSSVPTSTAPLTSSSPVSVSGSIINPGMVSSTVSSTATVLATPLICFPYDGKTYTDYNGQNYTINCGYDLTGQNLNGNGQSVNSFEACIELCDSTAGCGGVTHVGGNGAGTCILKTGQGSLVYDGHTFVAVLASVSSRASSTVSAAASSTTSLSSTPPKTATLRPTAQASTCPEANNNVYVDENVVDYNVYCSSDTYATTFNDTTIGSGGFTACFTICDVTPDCVGFTFEGESAGTCHFKNQFGNILSAPSNFVLAFLSSGQNSTSNVSSAASTSLTMVSTSVLPSLSTSTSSALTYSVQSSTLSSSAPATSTTASSLSSLSLSTSQSTSLSSSATSTLALTTSSTSPQTIVYYVAPPCPSSKDNICDTNTPTTCSNAHGANFDVNCGKAYTGTEMTRSKLRIMKRVTEPTYTDCLNLCDGTSGCVGVNYKGDECTLFSEITGTIPDPDNVAATLLPPVPITPTTSDAATSTPTASTLPTSSSSSVSLSSSSSISSPSSSAASPSPAVPMCPGAAGQTYTDSNGANYTVACNLNVQGGDLSSPYRAASILNCLPSCDVTSGCIGVVYDTAASSCQMKSTFTGTQVPGANFMIAARASMSSASISSSATITITTLTGGGTYESSPVATATGGACSAPASGSVGTTTVFTTATVTACPTPGMCPQEGFGWGGTLFGSNFSSFGMAPQTISGGIGSVVNGGSGGSPTSTVIVTGSAPSNGAAAVPVCPGSNGNVFTDSLGQVYEIGCGRLITDETISTSNVSSLTSCIDACDMYNIQNFNYPSGCLGVSFYPALAAGNCELKTGSTNVTSPDADSARLLSRAVDPGNSTTGNGGQTVVSTASGGGGGGQVITITAGGGNYITVTQVVTSYASPTSSPWHQYLELPPELLVSWQIWVGNPSI